VTRREDLEAAFQRMLADPDEPWLLDVVVAAEENVYPMIPAGGSYKDIIMSAEDLPEAARETQGSNI
jgi:acetolactate synthase-1/2/3 large subunit